MGTEYRFDPNLSRAVRGLSLGHVPLPASWFWLLAKWGYDERALPAAAVVLAAVVLLTVRVTDPSENINWAFLPRKRGWRVPMPV